ncbi:hypothetical protein Pla8534_23080 [Lignipirellula cremea]|uniref:Uncharacterized protein n=2 Tax=Lignipirellula cremea TaxID=2528010 RepID=A0A518DRP2_9BACT|nr:hypothetical protein Pla8534_23080 [Lignipirellula cremea]
MGWTVSPKAASLREHLQGEKSASPEAEERCLNPECEGKTSLRGLCKSCYAQALKMVKSGDVDWATLEQYGAARPPFKKPRRLTKYARFLATLGFRMEDNQPAAKPVPKKRGPAKN